MKKIFFLLLSGLPVPAVDGGAIETLLQILIEQNEIYHNFDFKVICVGSEKAKKESTKYKYTEFVFFKNSKVDFILERFSRCVYRLFRVVLPHSDACFKALKYLKKNKDYDILVNETWKVYLSTLFAKVAPKDKIVTHIHRKGEVSKGDISKKIDNNIGYLLSVSDFISNDWCTETGRDKNKAFVLKNCCDTYSFKKRLSDIEKLKLKKKLHIDDDKVVIIFVGRITAEKGLKELLMSLNMIRDKDKIHLLIVGGSLDGSKTVFEKEIDEIVSNHECSISQIGYVDNSEIYKYYSISDIAVLPSVCPDAALLTGIEAMTAGIPVITSNIGGIPEYSSSDAAILVDVDESFLNNLASSIQKLVNDEVLRANMKEKSLKRSLRFTPENYYKDFCNIICKILSMSS